MTEARIHSRYALYHKLMEYCGDQGAYDFTITSSPIMMEDFEDCGDEDEFSPEEYLEASKFQRSILKMW